MILFYTKFWSNPPTRRFHYSRSYTHPPQPPPYFLLPRKRYEAESKQKRNINCENLFGGPQTKYKYKKKMEKDIGKNESTRMVEYILWVFRRTWINNRVI